MPKLWHAGFGDQALCGTASKRRGHGRNLCGGAIILGGRSRKTRGRKWMLFVGLLVALAAHPAAARQPWEPPPPRDHQGGQSAVLAEDPRLLCQRALRRVEIGLKIPDGMLVALGQIESSLWPWSLNVAGQPRRYPTREAAEAALREALKSTTSIAIGCGQVHARWHGEAIGSALLYLDPDLNAAYAGWYLTELLQRHCAGSWGCAGRRYYGSADPEEQGLRECRWAKAIAILRELPEPDCRTR